MIREIKLTLGEKERTFTFGIMFIGNVLERLDMDYNTLLEKVSKNPFKYAPILMFESLVNTSKKNKEDVNFTEDDLLDWLENEELLGVELMLQFINAFMGTQENKTPVKDTSKGKSVKKK
jgi:adenine deaminase